MAALESLPEVAAALPRPSDLAACIWAKCYKNTEREELEIVPGVQRRGTVHVAAQAPETKEQIGMFDHHQRAAKVTVRDAGGGVEGVGCDAVVHWQPAVGAETSAGGDKEHVCGSESLGWGSMRGCCCLRFDDK